MLFISFLPKPAQVILYRIISVVFLIPTIVLITDEYYVAAFVAALGSVAIMAASFVVAKWARDEEEAERQKAEARAAQPAPSPASPAYPPAYPAASAPGWTPPSAPPSYTPYTPTPSIPPLPPMPNMPTGGGWSNVPPPGLPPNAPLPDTAAQTSQESLPQSFPRRSSAASSTPAWAGPVVTLLGMALFVVLGVVFVGYVARHSASNNAAAMSAQAWRTNTAVRQQRSTAPPRAEKRVLALYYPWYRTPQHSYRWEHQSGVDTAHRRMESHTHYPAQGPYDSADADVLDRQLEQAAQAGIDTFVCSWWGKKDATDGALRLLIERAAKTHIKICVLWEQVSGQAGIQSLDSDLAYLLETFGKQPAYLRVQDEPVVFVLDRVGRSANVEGWLEVQNYVARRYAPGALLIGDGYQQEPASVWNGYFLLGAAAPLIDGQTPSACARVQNGEYGNMVSVSRSMHRLSVVSVFPGYDDRKPNAALHLAGRTFLDRHDGQLYGALWQQAMANDPDWILVNSFNQWHAGTEIEPSIEMGDKYLRLTHQYATQFKNRPANP